MKKYLLTFLFSIALLGLLTVTAGAETTLDVAEQYIARMQFYEQIDDKDAPVSVTEAGTESVNNANGSLTYTQVDLSLPGKNGMDFNVTRKLNGVEQYVTNLTIIPTKDVYSLKSTNKFIYRYFINNDTSRPVFIAYDTPQDMLDRENGTNQIQIPASYTSMGHQAREVIGKLVYEIGGSCDNIGFDFDSTFYYINELPAGDDVVLYRDLDNSYTRLIINSMHAYNFSTTSIGMKDTAINYTEWDMEIPTLQYTPTRAEEVQDGAGNKFRLFYGNLYPPSSANLKYSCINGVVYDSRDDVVENPVAGEYYTGARNSGDHMQIVGDNIINLDTQEVYRLNILDIRRNCAWKYLDRGVFYDTTNGMVLDFKLEYFTNHIGVVTSVINCIAYNYLPNPSGTGEYYSQNSAMYSVQMEQNLPNLGITLTFTRYDGMRFEYQLTSNSANLADQESNSASFLNTRTIPVSKQIDKYDNTISYETFNMANKVIKDTYNREIVISEYGIFVNGVQVVSYSTGYENNPVVDPNNLMEDDDNQTLTVAYAGTDKEYKYYFKQYMDVYLMGEKDEGDNPFDLTKSTSTLKMSAVELPTGGKINFAYTSSYAPVPMQTMIKRSSYKLAKRYETLPGSSEEINPVYYTYDHSNADARKTTVQKGTSDAYTVTEIYDEEGYLTNSTEQSNDTNNSYYIEKSYIYQKQNEGNSLPVKETTTVKSAADAAGAQTVVMEKEYNNRQQLTAQKRDGAYILHNSYDSVYGVTTSSYQKRDDTMWVGVSNTLTADKKNIATSYAAERADMNSAPQTHEATTYTYTTTGDIASTTAQGVTTTYSYNYANYAALLTAAQANSLTKTATVSDVGNLADSNAAGSATQDLTTTEVYDGLGRLLQQNAQQDGHETETIDYVYDLMGNLTQMVDSDGTTTYTYSKNGDLLSETRASVVKNYAYDANGNRISFTVPAYGISASYVYDGLGRMTSFTDAGETTAYTYDANNNLLSETTTGGRTVTYSYNKANLLTSKTNKLVANTLETYAIEYYPDGNVKKVTENGVPKEYTYDGIGRLTKETTADAVTQYAYDKYNNRTGKQVYDNGAALQSETAYTYDKNNRLTDIVQTAGGATLYTELAYDKNGNRIMEMFSGTSAGTAEEPTYAVTGSSGYVATYSYDLLGRMTAMQQGETTASYTYDGNGMRQSKTVNGVTTAFLLDGMHVTAEVENEAVRSYYSRGMSLVSRSAGGNKDYYYTNNHGDVTKLVNGSGTVVAEYTYDAYGNQTGETEDSNPFRYAGEYFDSESGLIYLRARYYDASVGGFLSEDPAKDGLNWYVYCGGNPVNFWDPSGLARITPLEGPSDNMDVYLRDMFNMYRTSDSDQITMFDGGVIVELNGRRQEYYYDTASNGSVHGNKMDGDRMMVNAVEFGRHFGLTKTAVDSGSGSRTFAFNEGEGIPTATLNYDYYFQVSYVDTPNGIAVFQQNATFTMTLWTGIPGESSEDLPIMETFGVGYYNSSGQNVRTPFVPQYTPADPHYSYGLSQTRFRSDQSIMLPKGTTTAKATFGIGKGGAMNGLFGKTAIVRLW